VSTSLIRISVADRRKTVRVVVDQKVDIDLQTIGPGHYGDPEVSSTVVRFLGVANDPVQNPGGPRQHFGFQCVAVGSVLITIPHTVQSEPFAVTLQCWKGAVQLTP
jgi:hypothetical protein